MRATTAAAGVLAALALAACDRGGEAAEDTESTIRPGAGTEWGDEAQPPGGTPELRSPHMAGAATITGQLAPVGGSDVGGSVTLRDVGGRTLVSLQVSRAPAADRNLRAAIHQGTCTSPGPEVARLRPLPVQQSGMVAQEDTLDAAPATVMDGRNVLVVWSERATGAAPPLACAAIPAATGPAGPGDPPETGTPGAAVPPSAQPGTAPGTPPPGSTDPQVRPPR
jgi:hypothetical protein